MGEPGTTAGKRELKALEGAKPLRWRWAVSAGGIFWPQERDESHLQQLGLEFRGVCWGDQTQQQQHSAVSGRVGREKRKDEVVAVPGGARHFSLFGCCCLLSRTHP